MKELEQVSTNHGAALTEDGRLVPQAEVIFVYSEPHYRIQGRGNEDSLLKVERHTGSMRLMMGPKKMRALAKVLTTGADQLEADVAAALSKAHAEA